MYMYFKRNIFFFNLFVVILMITFILLRLHNIGLINLRFNEKIAVKKRAEFSIKPTISSTTLPLKIPWRFQIEEDGFVFPPNEDNEKFITYERLNGSWTKQLLQFENANIFAYLLKRTLLVPPLMPYKKYESENESVSKPPHSNAMSELIDFDLLSSMVRLGEINSSQVEEIKRMPKYNVCHDPRLGFWLDYIPSVENIQTWRVLKEQYFSPIKLNLNGLNREYMCPGTLHYMDRWGPPLRVKALYRGILTELSKRDEDIIYFQGDTLDTTNIRFFDKQRAKKAQELLLFFIRFSKNVTKKTKKLATLLHFGYIAVLANHVADTTGIVSYIANEANRIGNAKVSNTLFIVCNTTQQNIFKELEWRNFTVYFAHEFIRDNLIEGKKKVSNDQLHFLSLLLCAYATHFIGLPGTSDLYYVEHLRLQDANMVDGLVTDKVSVRWAKHTIRDRADERKILRKTTSTTTTTTIFPKTVKKTKSISNRFHKNINTKIKRRQSVIQTQIKLPEPKKSHKLISKKNPDKLYSIACSFCNYIRRVTGIHGCPTMKRVC